jgi:hypothetical protein
VSQVALEELEDDGGVSDSTWDGFDIKEGDGLILRWLTVILISKRTKKDCDGEDSVVEEFLGRLKVHKSRI